MGVDRRKFIKGAGAAVLAAGLPQCSKSRKRRAGVEGDAELELDADAEVACEAEAEAEAEAEGSEPGPQCEFEPGPVATGTGLVYDERYKLHDPTVVKSWHPEKPERCDAILDALRTEGLEARMRATTPRMATEAELLLCHTQEYIDRVKEDVATGEDYADNDGDTCINEHSWDVALLAAGGGFVAVDAVMRGEVRNAFCLIRPPGHHAKEDHSMGYCILNNAALAARYAQDVYCVERVLIVDWDVHHGNGTQRMFYTDGSVFYFSTHRENYYPGTGSAQDTGILDGEGTILNCPYPAGAGRQEIVVESFQDRLVPAMDGYQPDLVVISAGFDSHAGDTHGFELTDADFAELTAIVMGIAREYGRERVVSVLEGGYALDALAGAAAAHVEALIEG